MTINPSYRHTAVAVALAVSLPLLSQSAKLLPQRKFPKAIPAGNYSGIAALGGNRYAVVSDKSPDGFFLFRIDIDSITGHILDAACESFLPSGRPNRDQEGIAYDPLLHRLFISGEADGEIHEHALDGTLIATHPVAIATTALPNRSLEALTFDSSSRTFFTTTETPVRGDSLLRILQLDSLMQPIGQYSYRLDPPKHRKKRRNVVANGVSALCALGDGRLLVLEREVYVPPLRIGSSVRVRLYAVRPSHPAELQKTLVCQFTTHLNITSRKFANYEGLCLARPLADGRHLLLLIADSQNQLRGYLRDWMRTIIVESEQNAH